MEKFDDEDPGTEYPVTLAALHGSLTVSKDIIQGAEPEWLEDLGVPRRRDPDALPPQNVFETMMNYMYKGAIAMRGGNTLFAIKAATLTGMILHVVDHLL
jgi:hypothetical protein